MAPPATPRDTPGLPRWMRSPLSAALIDGRDEDRPRRDLLVDAAMFLIAFAISAFALAQPWAQHPGWLRVVEVAIGLAALASLRWRRTHPAAVGIFTAAVSIVIIAAPGPQIIAPIDPGIRPRGRGLAGPR